MPPRHLRPQFRWVYPNADNQPHHHQQLVRAPEVSAVIELDESSGSFPAGHLAGECGVQLRPHQLTLAKRCAELEDGPVELSQPVSDTLTRVASNRGGPQGDAPGEMRSTLSTRVGVIGDKAGSGKSFVILGIVAAGRATLASPDPIVRSFADDRVVLTTHRCQSSVVETTLLVVPHNLCSQWETYLMRWNAEGNTSPIRYAMVSRNKHVLAIRQPGALDAVDLVVVTSTFYNAVAAVLSRGLRERGARLRRVVFDEADSLAISGLSMVDACFHWFVTASYRNMIFPFGDSSELLTGDDPTVVQRTTGVRSSGFIKSLWSDLGHTAMSRSVSHVLVAKNSNAYVDASMRLPETDEIEIACRAPAALRVLSGVVGIDRAVMQSLNAGDVESALQHVDPANRGSEDNVIRVLIARLEREAHNFDVRIASLEGMAYAAETLRDAERSRLERRRDDVRRRVESIRERVAGADVCSICYETFSNKAVAPCCSNAFCFECISKWLLGGEETQRHAHAFPGRAVRPGVCPLCKSDVAVRDLLVVTASHSELSVDGGGDASSSNSHPEADGSVEKTTSPDKCKIDNLEAILHDRCCRGPGRSKVLVFSSFENSFGDIVRVLERLNIKHRFLKGNHFTIAGIEREYRQGDLDVLLVNTSHCGSGLNLENTTDVIMMHKFDTDIEHQVIGRAQRCGRTAPLKVWYLLHDNERSGAVPPS